MKLYMFADRYLKNDSEVGYVCASYKDFEIFKKKFIELGIEVVDARLEISTDFQIPLFGEEE